MHESINWLLWKHSLLVLKLNLYLSANDKIKFVIADLVLPEFISFRMTRIVLLPLDAMLTGNERQNAHMHIEKSLEANMEFIFIMTRTWKGFS
ncbi:MAG: hypothetical protein OEZ01_16695 [Candidatus Heimdallarchaeota archaeon]|nr:hypothetical protein [Candidatus Heimdallarchaeota archaeon]